MSISGFKIMGVVNVTPDSFSDGNLFFKTQSAVDHTNQLMDEGADIIDIGAESTRPGAHPVDDNEQIKRLSDIVKAVADQGVISIDTQSPRVFETLLPLGVDIINDTNALQSPGMLGVVSQTAVDVVLMHMKGQPPTMQNQPTYQDVCDEVIHFFEQRIESCLKVGISLNRIILDPGIGFGKTLVHNLEILSKLSVFKALGCQLLVGLSRKSMVSELTDEPVNQRLYGSLGGAMAAFLNGADIIRVHDVKATVQSLKVFSKIVNHKLG